MQKKVTITCILAQRNIVCGQVPDRCMFKGKDRIQNTTFSKMYANFVYISGMHISTHLEGVEILFLNSIL